MLLYVFVKMEDKIMNNATKMEWKIKMRYDNVYDLYLNGKHIASRGSHESILAELKALMEENI